MDNLSMFYYSVRIIGLSVLVSALSLYALVLLGPELPGFLAWSGYHEPKKCYAPTKRLRALCRVVSSATHDQPVQAYHLKTGEPEGWNRWIFRHLHGSESPHGVYNTLTGEITIYKADEHSLPHLVRTILHEQKHAWQLTHSPGTYLLSLTEATKPYSERILENNAKLYARRNEQPVLRQIMLNLR